MQFVVITSGRVYFLPLEGSEIDTFKRMAEVVGERTGFEPVVIKGSDDVIGIVTVHDGPSLPEGQIIAPTVGDEAANATLYHNNFQDPEKFLQAGGLRGRQLQTLVEGHLLHQPPLRDGGNGPENRRRGRQRRRRRVVHG